MGFLQKTEKIYLMHGWRIRRLWICAWAGGLAAGQGCHASDGAHQRGPAAFIKQPRGKGPQAKRRWSLGSIWSPRKKKERSKEGIEGSLKEEAARAVSEKAAREAREKKKALRKAIEALERDIEMLSESISAKKAQQTYLQGEIDAGPKTLEKYKTLPAEALKKGTLLSTKLETGRNDLALRQAALKQLSAEKEKQRAEIEALETQLGQVSGAYQDAQKQQEELASNLMIYAIDIDAINKEFVKLTSFLAGLNTRKQTAEKELGEVQQKVVERNEWLEALHTELAAQRSKLEDIPVFFKQLSAVQHVISGRSSKNSSPRSQRQLSMHSDGSLPYPLLRRWSSASAIPQQGDDSGDSQDTVFFPNGQPVSERKGSWDNTDPDIADVAHTPSAGNSSQAFPMSQEDLRFTFPSPAAEGSRPLFSEAREEVPGDFGKSTYWSPLLMGFLVGIAVVMAIKVIFFPDMPVKLQKNHSSGGQPGPARKPHRRGKVSPAAIEPVVLSSLADGCAPGAKGAAAGPRGCVIHVCLLDEKEHQGAGSEPPDDRHTNLIDI